MASLALTAIRAAERLPLPATAKAHLERCASIELFDSVFDASIPRPTLGQVFGLVSLGAHNLRIRPRY
jgi:hypothetical protein